VCSLEKDFENYVVAVAAVACNLRGKIAFSRVLASCSENDRVNQNMGQAASRQVNDAAISLIAAAMRPANEAGMGRYTVR